MKDIPDDPVKPNNRPFNPMIKIFNDQSDPVTFLNEITSEAQNCNASMQQQLYTVTQEKYYEGAALDRLNTWRHGMDSKVKHIFNYVGSDKAVIKANYKEFRRLLLSTYLKKNVEGNNRMERDSFRLLEFNDHPKCLFWKASANGR